MDRPVVKVEPSKFVRLVFDVFPLILSSSSKVVEILDVVFVKNSGGEDICVDDCVVVVKSPRMSWSLAPKDLISK
jgi:hypothetical protein